MSKSKPMSPIVMIAIGTATTIIGAAIAGIGTYRQHLASSEKTSKIRAVAKE
jgi:hypothetical protein